MELHEARALAKKVGRKLSVKTISFMDLARDSKKFFYLSPAFPQYYKSDHAREVFLSSLNSDELILFNTDYLCDKNNTKILKG